LLHSALAYVSWSVKYSSYNVLSNELSAFVMRIVCEYWQNGAFHIPNRKCDPPTHNAHSNLPSYLRRVYYAFMPTSTHS
jgi:hypothetical protein